MPESKSGKAENVQDKNFADVFIEQFILEKKKQGLCRALSGREISLLKSNHNRAQNWSDIYVAGDFDAERILDCTFWGKIFIGSMDKSFLESEGIRLPVGLYHSTIASSIILDNTALHHTRYLAGYIVEERAMLLNNNEIFTTQQAVFGHGFLKNGSNDERLWLEVVNEAGGRSILPFKEMLPADAYLWASFREDETLQQRFVELTDKLFTAQDFTLGKIGADSVLIDNRLIQDMICGSHCRIKGTTRLENVFIRSSADEQTLLGSGVELKDGIVGAQNKIEYDVKAIRFATGRNVHLEYGARVINTFVSPNSTIACCEVLSNLVYPFHEQHHNNSFLIASLVMGQANIAAGATIGSNHNSRAADGEILARRGFWPGLVTNFKHNSSFASFTIIAKGNYYAELNITLPFCLVSPSNDMDVIRLFPGFWFKYNMYALARNAWKFEKRDKRKIKEQHIETDYLAPDTIEEILQGIRTLHRAIEEAAGREMSVDEIEAKAEELDKTLKVYLRGQLNKGKALVLKPAQGIRLYRMLVKLYGARSIVDIIKNLPPDKRNLSKALQSIRASFYETDRSWENVGGQLIAASDLNKLLEKIKSKELDSWQAVHSRYNELWNAYADLKRMHGLNALLRLLDIKTENLSESFIKELLRESAAIAEQLSDWAFESRRKDYSSEFRRITFRSEKEMEAVTGRIEDNSFLNDYKVITENYLSDVDAILRQS